MRRIFPKLYCLQDDAVKIYGDYNTNIGSQLVVAFERCSNETLSGQQTCRPNEEIDQWINRKFLVMYLNQIVFEKTKVEPDPEKKIVESGMLLWNVVTP